MSTPGVVERRWWRKSRPMRCREVAQLVQAYLDDSVDEESARMLEDHLEDCRRCGLGAQSYRDIKAALQRRDVPLDALAVRRLRSFGNHLVDEEPPR